MESDEYPLIDGHFNFTRKGELFTIGIYLHSPRFKEFSLWNSDIFLNELVVSLLKMGKKPKEKRWIVCRANGYHHKEACITLTNPTGTMEEIIKIGLEIIENAKKETHINLLNLAAKELKAISKS